MRLLRYALLGALGLAYAANTTNGSRDSVKSTFSPPQHFRNVNLVRNINLEKSYARDTVNVVIENVSPQPQSEYYIAFDGSIQNIGGVEVRDKKDAEKGRFQVELVADPLPSTAGFYKVTFPTAVKAKEQLTLSITYFSISVLQPLPALINQNEKQYVSFDFSAYAPSAYTTLKQKTKLKLPTTDVPDATVVPKELNAENKLDPQKEAKTFTYGPYNEQSAGSERAVSVRYEYTHPLTHGRLLERDIEVSHWGGNIATEERHWLSNRGAALKDHFSRVKYQQAAYYNPPSNALKELRFPLPVGSIDAYFVDDIGNVSTSRFRANARESNLELKPRYPLFGNWNYSFKAGWSANLDRFLRKVKGSSHSYVLNVRFFEGPRQNEGVEYERVVTRIILPEGALDEILFYKTYFDTVGRTTLKLTAINLVDELRDRELIVTYDYPFLTSFRKPLTIFTALMLVFAASWVVGNLDVSIGKKQKAA
ncbi:hypothetical protein MRB53_039921 [Persea americana]|nr:hypothetical protein MRB53_039921 [Persea americana]